MKGISILPPVDENGREEVYPFDSGPFPSGPGPSGLTSPTPEDWG